MRVALFLSLCSLFLPFELRIHHRTSSPSIRGFEIVVVVLFVAVFPKEKTSENHYKENDFFSPRLSNLMSRVCIVQQEDEQHPGDRCHVKEAAAKVKTTTGSFNLDDSLTGWLDCETIAW